VRPERLVLITGTGTEVGKTWVACRLARALRERGLKVAARKPVQSFAPEDAPSTTDAALLARATGETDHVVCLPHRWYPRAMAPPMAAEALGLPEFRLDDLVHEIVWPDGVSVGLVEAAGGVRSPIATDGDTVGLAERLKPDHVVLVADTELGVLNDVRLAVEVLAPWPVTVMCNRYDADNDLHRRNLTWLDDREELNVVVTAEQLVSPLLGWGLRRS
jgi:dethiobiotin synthetase